MKSKSRRLACRKCRRHNCNCSRKSSRSSRRVNQRGGWVVLNPADINDTSMKSAGNQNLAQGGEYNKMHNAQHGGGVLEGAPVGTTGMLDSSLRGAAHLDPLDKSTAAIQGMSDQSGGARRRNSRRMAYRRSSRKGRRASRRSSRKGRSASRKGRKSSRRASRRSSRKGR